MAGRLGRSEIRVVVPGWLPVREIPRSAPAADRTDSADPEPGGRRFQIGAATTRFLPVHVRDLACERREEFGRLGRIESPEIGSTAREVEVLEHLAEGETNRQIAESPFISIKTAGVHVSNILRKLDASTRSEAAAIAHRGGPLDARPGEHTRSA